MTYNAQLEKNLKMLEELLMKLGFPKNHVSKVTDDLEQLIQLKIYSELFKKLEPEKQKQIVDKIKDQPTKQQPIEAVKLLQDCYNQDQLDSIAKSSAKETLIEYINTITPEQKISLEMIKE